MNGRTGLLLGLMIAQLLVIGLLLLVNNGSSAAPDRMLAIDPQRVTRLALAQAADPEAGTSEAALLLLRSPDGWLADGNPADGDKVERLLQRLAELGPGWPVATTGTARERFAVAEDNFRKKLTLTLEDDSTETLLLGTSPGFKRLHARRSDSDAIYSIALGDFDLPVKASDWLDKALLALPEAVTAAERRGALRIERESVDTGEWRLTGSADESGGGASAEAAQLAASENVERWLNLFESLRVIDVFADTAPEEPTDVFLFTTAAGELTYRLYEDAEANRFILERNDVDGRYEIPSYIALQLRASLDSLLPAAADTGENSATEEAETAE